MSSEIEQAAGRLSLAEESFIGAVVLLLCYRVVQPNATAKNELERKRAEQMMDESRRLLTLARLRYDRLVRDEGNAKIIEALLNSLPSVNRR